MNTIVYRGKEYSIDALKNIANQGILIKISASLIDGVPENNGLSVPLDTVIVVQSKNRYDWVIGKLQSDQATKEARSVQTVRLFSTYALKKALVINVLAQKEAEVEQEQARYRHPKTGLRRAR